MSLDLVVRRTHSGDNLATFLGYYVSRGHGSSRSCSKGHSMLMFSRNVRSTDPRTSRWQSRMEFTNTVYYALHVVVVVYNTMYGVLHSM